MSRIRFAHRIKEQKVVFVFFMIDYPAGAADPAYHVNFFITVASRIGYLTHNASDRDKRTHRLALLSH